MPALHDLGIGYSDIGKGQKRLRIALAVGRQQVESVVKRARRSLQRQNRVDLYRFDLFFFRYATAHMVVEKTAQLANAITFDTHARRHGVPAARQQDAGLERGADGFAQIDARLRPA